MSSDEFTISLHRKFIKKVKKLRLPESYAKKIKAIIGILKFDPLPWKNFDFRMPFFHTKFFCKFFKQAYFF